MKATFSRNSIRSVDQFFQRKSSTAKKRKVCRQPANVDGKIALKKQSFFSRPRAFCSCEYNLLPKSRLYQHSYKQKKWLLCTHYTRMNCSFYSISILVGHFSLVCFMSWLPGTESYHCKGHIDYARKFWVLYFWASPLKKKRHLRKKLCQKFSSCAIKFGKIRGVRFTP